MPPLAIVAFGGCFFAQFELASFIRAKGFLWGTNAVKSIFLVLGSVVLVAGCSSDTQMRSVRSIIIEGCQVEFPNDPQAADACVHDAMVMRNRDDDDDDNGGGMGM